MKFKVIAEVFNTIEPESSRLAITKLLADLLQQATPHEAAIIAYLSLGNLNPVYIGTKFHFAEKSLYKVIGLLLDCSSAVVATRMKKSGDVGLIIEKSDWNPTSDQELTVLQVDQALREFLNISGTGSQEAKETFLATLLSKLDKISAKYIVRVVLGKLRLGFSDMTLLDAFSWMAVGDKSLRKQLENAYNISADIGLIIRVLKEDGIKKIAHWPTAPPLLVVLAHQVLPSYAQFF